MTPESVDTYGTIHPDCQLRQEENLPRFKVFVYEHNPDEEPGWKYKLFLHDTKYSDSDGMPIDAVAGGDSWQEAFARAGAMIDMALNSDRCIF